MKELKANDLRVGNQILYKGDIITVLGIDPHCGDYSIKTETSWVYLKNCEGIPITGEILESLGFEITVNNKDSGYRQYGLNINGLDLMFCIECNSSFPEFYLCMVGVDVEYLHQLQNLYHALTGSDLQPKS